MRRVIYSVASSLDGYNTDAQGDYSWAVPDEEVIAALNADAGEVSTYLYGRRMYEAMAGWETDPAVAAQSPESAAFAATWQAAHKIVFSAGLPEVWTKRTRLERELTAEAVERARAEASGDLTVEGPTLARSALRLGLVDVIELLICPVVVGAGTPVLPDGFRTALSLTRERRFSNGMVQLTYAVR
ncbi:dihydrofolate reductase [Saccharopolyspora erythraea NRRL 2338]|uniref:Bifunctional deaminase-reductase domain protein n=3 Tax=Saccharopolyspora erythraea TaxID=1836 RepID=A4FG21_SACEN|nr:dihydrofolate reductase family protein [Saccharopolyspora erythraea]EQD85495.1 deaminase reductase [Saccharopolyspora erythraea D]PFG96701.1 dihydrofolate reductase [Saccharopolyspora erythraea NRRL 2338]QRK93646.1 dihydrofolate reductase family protein [Saccharopolyspora erythraea]CAM02996.1 bifunctional deaminase-reductase domain protein [Saccharopolyspora erythraea NRRL 2338]